MSIYNSEGKPIKKGISKGKKALIVIIPIAVILAIFVIAGSQRYVNTNADEIAGITQFFVLEDGSITNVRFSLVDTNGYAAASDAKVMIDLPGYEKYWFDIKASEFAEYKLRLTGQPIFAYAWQFNHEVGTGDAFLTVTLPNGVQYNATGYVF